MSYAKASEQTKRYLAQEVNIMKGTPLHHYLTVARTHPRSNTPTLTVFVLLRIAALVSDQALRRDFERVWTHTLRRHGVL